MGNKTPYIVCGVIIILLVGGVVGYSLLEKDVTIEYDGKTLEVSTFSRTVKDVLREENIILSAEDVTVPEADSSLSDGMKIIVKRAFPVKVICDGQEKVLRTQPDTVENLLTKAKVTLKEKDKVEPEKNQYIYSSTDIIVTRVEEKTLIEIKDIPYETVSRKDYDLLVGEKKVVQKGKIGKEKIVTKLVLENGEVVSKQEIREVLESPKPEIVLTGALMVASRGGTEFSYTQKMKMLASAYTHTGNKTATNTQPRRGVVAVDPNVIPLGTRLYVEGYGYARAEDTGGAIKGNKIDLFMDTKDEIKKFGRRWVTVYVLK